MRRLGITVFPDIVNALILTSIVSSLELDPLSDTSLVHARLISFRLATVTSSEPLVPYTPLLSLVRRRLS